MKKLFTFMSVMFMMAFSFTAMAQPDTVFIAGNPAAGVLKDAIIGDTLADGSRTNPERCYELERNAIYNLSGMFVADFDLCIIAKDPDATHRPPIIAPSSAAGIDHDFICKGNVYFKNLYISNIAPDASRNFGGILCFGEDKEYTMDGCVLEGNQWNSFVIFNKTKKITFTDCVVRNAVHSSNPWNGRGLSTRDFPVETVVIENNTFFNLNSFVFRGEWNEIKNFSFNHNTIVNTIKWPVQWHYMTNATFSDNIFYNAHSFGESESERAGQDKDGQVFGLFNVFELDEHDFIDSLGYTEAGRMVTVSNNNWFYSPEIVDFWASIDSVDGEVWMNERTQGFFDDDAGYPFLVEYNTHNVDPQFVNPGTMGTQVLDSMILFMKGLRDEDVTRPAFWGYEPDPTAYPFTMEWPLPEDFSYTNSDLMYGGTGGCPLGDLNWFPDRKEDCTGLVGNKDVETTLTAVQSNPNPFKGQTTISYTLANASKVSVKIIDINGRVIATLVNTNQGQGHHTVEWNAENNATGVYFYQIQTNNSMITNKLDVIK